MGRQKSLRANIGTKEERRVFKSIRGPLFLLTQAVVCKYTVIIVDALQAARIVSANLWVKSSFLFINCWLFSKRTEKEKEKEKKKQF